MSKRVITRLAVLFLGCATQVPAAMAQGRGMLGSGMFRPPGYGTPGGGGSSPLGTYGELGDRARGAGGGTAAAVVDRESRVDEARIGVPVGDYGVTIPVPGGVGTAEMDPAGASSARTAALPGGRATQAPTASPARVSADGR